MTTREVIKVAEEYGFRIILKDGRPELEKIVKGDSSKTTDKLMAVLKIHRESIIAILSKEQQNPPLVPSDSYEGPV